MIPLLPLRLDFTAAVPLRLPPYPGSLWRSALGARLRRLACITGAKTCAGCPVVARCAYGLLFETPRPPRAPGLVEQYAEVPHPYVISPRHSGGKHPAGAQLAVELILLGAGVSRLPELLSAVRGLRINRVTLSLEQLALLPPVAAGSGAEPVQSGSLLDARPVTPEPPPAPGEVRMILEHPLRLRRNNRYLRPDDFDFGTFFTTLMRRISMLRALGDETPLHVDYAGLANAARAATVQAQLRWFDWHRYSARQRRRIPMGGVVGELRLAGKLRPLWPWLWTGQWLHSGKGAVMGLGRYRLETPT